MFQMPYQAYQGFIYLFVFIKYFFDAICRLAAEFAELLEKLRPRYEVLIYHIGSISEAAFSFKAVFIQPNPVRVGVDNTEEVKDYSLYHQANCSSYLSEGRAILPADVFRLLGWDCFVHVVGDKIYRASQDDGGYTLAPGKSLVQPYVADDYG